MPRGELSSGKFAKRHPYDWHVEEQWVTRQLIDALGGFRVALENGDTFWDPCCGMGNIGAALGELVAFSGASHDRRLMLSDIVRRLDPAQLEGIRFAFGETRTIWLPPLGRPVPIAPLSGLSPDSNSNEGAM